MLKRKLILLTVIILMLASLVTGAANQEQIDVYDGQKQLVKSVVFILGQDRYFINDKTPGIQMDAKPFIEQARTFVPVRYLSNALGVTDEHITWESPKVILDEPGFPIVTLAVGSPGMNVNDGTRIDDKLTIMDVEPLIKEGRTYLPARWVAEALGYQVDWDAENSIVLCYPKGAEKPDVSNVIEYIKGQPVTSVSPVTPPVQPEQPANPELPTGETRPFSGKPLDPDDYVVAERKAIPYEFKQPGASIMEMTVEELRQKPVVMDGDPSSSGYMIIYDINVQKDKVYVKQADNSTTPMPAVLVLAKGNDVSVQRAYGPLVSYESNPFTHGYNVSLEADPGGGTKIEDVTHIMLLYSNQTLSIKNPLYKGGSK